MEDIIKINNLCKSFKGTKAVDNISFKVKKGEFFAFLGVNGAGKSTTINMMSGALKIDSGSIEICGYDVKNDLDEIKKNVGIVFQDSVLDKTLSVYDNLKYRAGYYGIYGKDFEERFEELDKLFKLHDIKNKQLFKLSGGQRRRVDIARSIIHSPKVLILDEPTTGLDPGTRKKIWASINKLRLEQGMTVFLTTHYMEETANADYVVIIGKGKIVAQGTIIDLKNKYASDMIYLYNIKEEEVKKLNMAYEKINDVYKIKINSSKEATKLINEHKEIFNDYEIIKGKMDDVFLAATHKEAKY